MTLLHSGPSAFGLKILAPLIFDPFAILTLLHSGTPRFGTLAK